jgi:hypothetical protein
MILAATILLKATEAGINTRVVATPGIIEKTKHTPEVVQRPGKYQILGAQIPDSKSLTQTPNFWPLKLAPVVGDLKRNTWITAQTSTTTTSPDEPTLKIQLERMKLAIASLKRKTATVRAAHDQGDSGPKPKLHPTGQSEGQIVSSSAIAMIPVEESIDSSYQEIRSPLL